ncbi:hypothetical protein pipiens_001702 [Culex pipiens pipiens]|uniref:Uncharacterized protein n=1 Tax=Culex pipiens pipiens TaxID=38569 RepID=A0ABD1CAP6_CULPP
MKALVLLTTALLVAATSAQVSLNVPLTITGNADGSVTIGPLGINIPASTMTTLEGLLSFVQSIAGAISPGNTQTVNIPITLNQGSVTVTLNGTPYTLDQATMAGVMAMVQQMGQMIMGGAMPGPGPMVGGHPPPPPPRP